MLDVAGVALPRWVTLAAAAVLPVVAVLMYVWHDEDAETLAWLRRLIRGAKTATDPASVHPRPLTFTSTVTLSEADVAKWRRAIDAEVVAASPTRTHAQWCHRPAGCRCTRPATVGGLCQPCMVNHCDRTRTD